jgi:hypothetical protein
MARSETGVLSTRALNRALLARQFLLDRSPGPALKVIERLVAMQAQVPRPPFMGLWTRLATFDRGELLRLFAQKKVVRATALRGTLHVMTTKDYLAVRPAIAAALVKGGDAILRNRTLGVDVETLYDEGRAFFTKTPAPFDAFREHLERKYPRLDTRAQAYTVRMGVPLVMRPEETTWGFPTNSVFISADAWLGARIPTQAAQPDALILRYLAAFGPATPGDAQVWSGLGGLRDAFERLRPKLVTFRDERKRELFDLPGAPRPDTETPAPVRFLPEFDNALLAHDDRTRLIAAEHRAAVFTKNLLVLGTFLVDGFVAGTWSLAARKKAATLQLAPFGRLAKKDAAALEAEGERLVEFLAPDAAARAVQTSR